MPCIDVTITLGTGGSPCRPHPRRGFAALLQGAIQAAALASALGGFASHAPAQQVAATRPAGKAVGEIETIAATRETSAAWADYELAFARHLMLANPERTFLGEVPAVLLAIPVLEIELEADGSVRAVRVKREPRQARDTVGLAIEAVHKAAPFPRVDHLPGPWVVQEVFLFNEHKRFRPRLLDR